MSTHSDNVPREEELRQESECKGTDGRMETEASSKREPAKKKKSNSKEQ